MIYHKRKPFKTSETFDRSIWTAILILEPSSVVSGVTTSCNIVLLCVPVKIMGQI